MGDDGDAASGGANTAIFSVVNEPLLRPLPYEDAGRIVMLWEVSPGGRRQNPTSRANYRGWREQSTAFEGMAAFYDRSLPLTGYGEPGEVSVQLATPELFPVLGVEPALGRVLSAEDARPGTPPWVILSYGLWKRRYGGDPQVLGKRLTLDGVPVTVVGVMPRGFRWHIKTEPNTGRPPEIWTLAAMPTEGPATRGRSIFVVARLKPGVSLPQAEVELKTIHARLEQDAPEFNEGFGAEVVPPRDQLVGNVRPTLLVLLGAVGFVLLLLSPPGSLDAGSFGAMGVPILRGRNFKEREESEARHVVLVSDALARQHFPGEDPIGKRINVQMSDKSVPTEIVGDVRHESLQGGAEPTAYLPPAELSLS